ncbi:hypothetical protein HDU91_003913, partial [Kappamyces sp. JEL0680]
VSKLAELRIQSCVDHAQTTVREKIQWLQETTECTDPNQHSPEELVFSAHSVVEISHQSFFDGSDKFDLVKDFAPPILIGLASLAGYRSLPQGLVRSSSASVSKIGRLVLAGLAISACGMVLLKLADMRRVMQDKIVNRLQQFFVSTKFVETNARQIAGAAHKSLQRNVYSIQRRFQSRLDESESSYLSTVQARADYEKTCQLYRNMEERRRALAIEIETLAID